MHSSYLFIVLLLITSVVSDFDDVLHKFPHLPAARERAVRWLLSQRQQDWGWGADTPRVVTTIQLADKSWLSSTDLASQLSVKQLELETMVALWSRNRESPLHAGRVAQFINSLISVCKDPRNFHGHDLVAMMDHMESPHAFEFSYVILALCNAGSHVRKKQVRRLLKIIDSSEASHNHDTYAILVQAMSCIVSEHHNRNLMNVIQRPIKKLKKSQKPDGSFGSVHTSAIVTQSLLPYFDEDLGWNSTAAIEFLLNQQQEDGSFGNQLITTAILPVLAGHNYANIPNTSCHFKQQNADSTHSSLSSKDETTPEPKPLSIMYSIWIGNNATENYTLVVTMPHNMSFYEIMLHAVDLDKRYEFEAKEWPNGHYVHTLNGRKENTTMNQYWLLGLLNPPAEKPVFIDMGVDEFYPKDGDHIVFWYKQI